MSLLDSYRRNVENKNGELLRLQNEKAGETKKVADLAVKIIACSQSIQRTANPNTRKSKMGELGRLEKAKADAEKKIAEISQKTAKKQKELNDEQKKVLKEEAAQSKKQTAEHIKQQQEYQKKINTINCAMAMHDSLHRATLSKIEKMEQLPEHIVVLFLASNPLGEQQLRLDEEARSIYEMIRKAKHRDAVRFETRWAVRPLDVLQAINELNPTIVHFSGHGSSDDEIIFQNAKGAAQFVSMNALTEMMAASSDSIKLVFFNTCHSYNQAKNLTSYVQAAIGMNTTIGDDAARVFSSQFYSAISFGLSLNKAFQQGKAALIVEGIAEEQTPELYVAENVDANHFFLVTAE